MRLSKILHYMEVAERENLFFAVAIRTKGSKYNEIIINHPGKLDEKFKYYSVAYDDDCRLKANPDIEIYDYCLCENFSQVENNIIIEN